MLKGESFAFNCEGDIGVKNFTVTYIWECNPICGGNTLYCVDENNIEYCFLERDDIVYKFIKCIDEENRMNLAQRKFIKEEFYK